MKGEYGVRNICLPLLFYNFILLSWHGGVFEKQNSSSGRGEKLRPKKRLLYCLQVVYMYYKHKMASNYCSACLDCDKIG